MRAALRAGLLGALIASALWAALGMQAGQSEGPVPPGTPISAIEFAGLQGVTDAFARSVVQARPGDTYDERAIEADVTRLIKTGRFDDARAEPQMRGGQVAIVFRLVERPVIASVELVGNRKFKTKDLLGESGLAAGQPISDYAIKQAQVNIERKYKEAGYYYAAVEISRARLESERVVELQIREGPRVRVRQIRFEGNHGFSAARLKQQIETHTYIWIFRTGEYDDERAERDAAAVRNFYRDQGYLDARVGHKPEFSNETDLTLTFTIEEGTRYSVKSITFQGNTVFSAEDLAGGMRLRSEGLFLAESLRQDVRAINDKYGAQGYIYADVATNWTYAKEEGFVDLTLTINERGQFRFGRIVIRGNAATQDKVVRRELRFFPEELYDLPATRVAERRLVETRLFNTARIEPVGEQPGVRDALVRVEEAETTKILFGVGVTTNNGLLGTVTIENRNFDLFDWPRNATEFFKGRAFHGAGQVFRLQFEPGTELTRGRIDFREPYLLDLDVGFGTSLYLFQRDRKEWDERRVGFNVSFDRRFREGLLKNWAAEAAFRFENVNIGGLDRWSPDEVRQTRGDNFLSTVKGTLVRDTTDSLFMPTRGNRLSVSYEQAFGDYSFGKIIGDGAQHFTLLTDSVNRKHILSLGGTIGQIVGDAPPFERFFGGGIGSIRGFEFRGVSPRSGWLMRARDRVGGDFELLANAEYSFPLIGETVRGVAFLDMGTIEEEFGVHDWRAAAGLGARIYFKPFGPIPLAFDFAFPISSNGDDDEQVFSFSFGTTF
ncbi:MAG: outer membrane protein assembly factor BamA [Phycisphaerae bacterium]